MSRWLRMDKVCSKAELTPCWYLKPRCYFHLETTRSCPGQPGCLKRKTLSGRNRSSLADMGTGKMSLQEVVRSPVERWAQQVAERKMLQ